MNPLEECVVDDELIVFNVWLPSNIKTMQIGNASHKTNLKVILWVMNEIYMQCLQHKHNCIFLVLRKMRFKVCQ